MKERCKMINKVSFIGAGSMAEAIIAGLVNKKFVKSEQIYVSNKENEKRLLEITEKYGVVGNSNKKVAIADADVVILATKPYDIEEAVTEIRDYLRSDQLVISVVAGISRSEEHTSELQSRGHLVCRLLLEKKK